MGEGNEMTETAEVSEQRKLGFAMEVAGKHYLAQYDHDQVTLTTTASRKVISKNLDTRIKTYS